MFTRGSRYETVSETEITTPEGRSIRYKRIRFLPSPEGKGRYMVQEGDRPDLAAWRIAQDPEAYWRLCDANGTARPAELTGTPGKRIVIPDATGSNG